MSETTTRFKPADKTQLQNAVNELKIIQQDRNNNDGYNQWVGKYGRMNDWDVSDITDMTDLFSGMIHFNENINDWDVSNVTSMRSMFNDCNSFNKPLNSWNVSNVVSMTEMFNKCRAFNKPLNGWNVSNVMNMEQMFNQCIVFNQSLNSWNVSNVTNMKEMFMNCDSFNSPLSSWDISNVVYMEKMFMGCRSFNKPLNHWGPRFLRNNVIENMNYMFKNCGSFQQRLDNWDLSNPRIQRTGILDGAGNLVGFGFPIINMPIGMRPRHIETHNNNNNINNNINNTQPITGRAFEIHEYFRKLNKEEILNVLESYNNDPNNQPNLFTNRRKQSPEQEANPNNPFTFIHRHPNIFGNIMYFITNKTLFIPEKREEGARYVKMLFKIDLIVKRFFESGNISRDLLAVLKKLVLESIKFVHRQSDDFIFEYIKGLTDECMFAYKGEANELSCDKGAVEKIITGVGNVAEYFCISENSGCTEIMKKLKSVFNKMSFSKLRNEWIRIYIGEKDNTEVKNLPKTARRAHFIDYMQQSVPTATDYTNAQIDDIANSSLMTTIFETGKISDKTLENMLKSVETIFQDWWGEYEEDEELKKMDEDGRRKHFIEYAKKVYGETITNELEGEIERFANQDKDEKGNKTYVKLAFSIFQLYEPMDIDEPTETVFGFDNKKGGRKTKRKYSKNKRYTKKRKNMKKRK